MRFGPDSGLAAGFGIGFTPEEKRVVVDDAWKRLEALVDGLSHGRRRHFANDLRRKVKVVKMGDRKWQEVTGSGSLVGGAEHHRSRSHHALEHQRLDDGAKPAHQLLDL